MRTALLLSLPALLLAQAAPERAVNGVLDDWHAAAAQADEACYFGHLAEDAVFLGTDATERWTKAQFQAYAHPYFAKGKAWTFRATRRAVTFSADGAPPGSTRTSRRRTWAPAAAPAS
jgi:ketosteroid isomerase-like protein